MRSVPRHQRKHLRGHDGHPARPPRTTRATAIERDATTGKLLTRSGAAFLLAWLVSIADRIGFVWTVTNVGSFREQVGEFMMSHQIRETAIPPFFVLMALTTVAALGAGACGYLTKRAGRGRDQRGHRVTHRVRAHDLSSRRVPGWSVAP